MGINAYATKKYEDNEYVVYTYGSLVDSQTGRIRFNKNPIELVILEKDVNQSRELFKIASRIKKIYLEMGSFPEKASSAS